MLVLVCRMVVYVGMLREVGQRVAALEEPNWNGQEVVVNNATVSREESH